MCNAVIGTEEDKSLTFLFLEQSAVADGGRWFAEGDFARRCQGHHGAACGATQALHVESRKRRIRINFYRINKPTSEEAEGKLLEHTQTYFTSSPSSARIAGRFPPHLPPFTTAPGGTATPPRDTKSIAGGVPESWQPGVGRGGCRAAPKHLCSPPGTEDGARPPALRGGCGAAGPSSVPTSEAVASLHAEDGDGAGAGAIVLAVPVLQDVPDLLQVLQLAGHRLQPVSSRARRLPRRRHGGGGQPGEPGGLRLRLGLSPTPGLLSSEPGRSFAFPPSSGRNRRSSASPSSPPPPAVAFPTALPGAPLHAAWHAPF